MSDLPALFTSATFADGEEVDNTKLYSRVLSPVNDINTYVAGIAPQSLQMARDTSSTLTIPDSTWTAVPSYGDGTTYVVGDGITYAGSGVFEVAAAGLYQWAHTARWSLTSEDHQRGCKIKINGSDAPYDQGHDSRWFTGNVPDLFCMTFGGNPVPLDENDLVQVFLYQDSGFSKLARPLVTTLIKVG